MSDTSRGRHRIPTAVIGALIAAAVLGVGTWWSLSSAAHLPSPRPSAAASPSGPLTALAPSAPPPADQDPSTSAPAVAHQALTAWDAAAPGAAHTVTGPGGTVQAVVRIPVLGQDWMEPVYDGVTMRQLNAGFGRFMAPRKGGPAAPAYPQSAAPGAIGNLTLAGHDSGVRSPALQHVTRIRPGDQVLVTTAARLTYIYTVTGVSPISAADTGVLWPVPGHRGAAPTVAQADITTCWPLGASTSRYVIQARLTSQRGGI